MMKGLPHESGTGLFISTYRGFLIDFFHRYVNIRTK
jgi:hypothetical protein